MRFKIIMKKIGLPQPRNKQNPVRDQQDLTRNIINKASPFVVLQGADGRKLVSKLVIAAEPRPGQLIIAVRGLANFCWGSPSFIFPKGLKRPHEHDTNHPHCY